MRTTRTTPTVFVLASKRCSIEVVLTSRKPLKAARWFPYVEETGGKIFRSNGSSPVDVRIALIADPLDTEVENRNKGTLDVLKVISTAPTSL